MLKNISDIYGTTLAATDGKIGHVKDFYFDDVDWAVRYLIVDTGSWLTGRQVLLSPHAFGGFRLNEGILQVNLTKAQIEDSPSIETHLTVTRQHEREYYQYYGWPAYWETSGMVGIGGMPILSAPVVTVGAAMGGPIPKDDVRLRSTRAVTGYDIKATDGTLGAVSGFRVDHLSWVISDLVVETGHWYSSKEIYISTAAVLGISYEQSEISVKLTRADLERTQEDEIAKTAFANR